MILAEHRNFKWQGDFLATHFCKKTAKNRSKQENFFQKTLAYHRKECYTIKAV